MRAKGLEWEGASVEGSVGEEEMKDEAALGDEEKDGRASERTLVKEEVQGTKV
jgi:hypothetical protein